MFALLAIAIAAAQAAVLKGDGLGHGYGGAAIAALAYGHAISASVIAKVIASIFVSHPRTYVAEHVAIPAIAKTAIDGSVATGHGVVIAAPQALGHNQGY